MLNITNLKSFNTTNTNTNTSSLITTVIRLSEGSVSLTRREASDLIDNLDAARHEIPRTLHSSAMDLAQEYFFSRFNDDCVCVYPGLGV